MRRKRFQTNRRCDSKQSYMPCPVVRPSKSSTNYTSSGYYMSKGKMGFFETFQWPALFKFLAKEDEGRSLRTDVDATDFLTIIHFSQDRTGSHEKRNLRYSKIVVGNEEKVQVELTRSGSYLEVSCPARRAETNGNLELLMLIFSASSGCFGCPIPRQKSPHSSASTEDISLPITSSPSSTFGNHILDPPTLCRRHMEQSPSRCYRPPTHDC